jgi:Rrf2 family protein
MAPSGGEAARQPAAGGERIDMRLTRASHYALIALTHMAQQPEPTKIAVASHEIATARNIPMRFLLKVLKPLVTRGVLRSLKGPTGGYVLRSMPAEITVLQIIEAVDGDIEGEIPEPWGGNPEKDVLPNLVAEKSNVPVNSKLLSICKQNAAAVKDHLKNVRLSDLAAARKESRARAARDD